MSTKFYAKGFGEEDLGGAWRVKRDSSSAYGGLRMTDLVQF